MVRHSAEDLELGFEVFSQIHDGGNIAAAVAVVRRGPDGDDIFVFEVVLQMVSVFWGDAWWLTYLVALVDKLVRSSDEL